jgi:hypothetical protein
MAEKVTRVQFRPEYIVVDTYDNDNGSKVINDFPNGKYITVALTTGSNLNDPIDPNTVQRLKPGFYAYYGAGLGSRNIVVLKPEQSTTSVFNVAGVKVINA